jgi:Uma2 family endonuclease
MNPRRMSVPIGPKPPPRGEDLPYDDGEPMETERHREQMWLLIESLRTEWATRNDVYIAGNMGLYFSETQARRNDFRAPDVFVVMDTLRRERKSWVVWEEDGRTPNLIIELVSETTEHVDRGIKKEVYAKLVRVPTYVIYDPFSAQLDVYALDARTRAYRDVTERDPHGNYECAGLGVSVGVVETEHCGVHAPWLRWFRSDGTLIPTCQETAAETKAHADEATAQADEAKAHADEARARAREAEERAARAEAELAKLRGQK